MHNILTKELKFMARYIIKPQKIDLCLSFDFINAYSCIWYIQLNVETIQRQISNILVYCRYNLFVPLHFPSLNVCISFILNMPKIYVSKYFLSIFVFTKNWQNDLFYCSVIANLWCDFWWWCDKNKNSWIKNEMKSSSLILIVERDD